MADNFYSKYPVTGGSGVSSLNSLTGALTLVAGSGITITPSGSSLTIAATGGGGGANQSLSNLTNPTAINQDLIFDTGALTFLKTKDDAAAATQSLTIQTGISTGFLSGDLTLASGASDTSVGSVFMTSGTPSAPNIGSGQVSLSTGAAIGSGASGNIFLQPGSSVDGNTGSVGITGGQNTGTTTGGSVSIAGGTASGTTGDGGSVSIAGGSSATGTGGSVDITTSSMPVNLNSGNIIVQPGAVSGTGVRGQIQLIDGSEGTAGYVWTSTDTTGKGHWAAGSGGGAPIGAAVTNTGWDPMNGTNPFQFSAVNMLPGADWTTALVGTNQFNITLGGLYLISAVSTSSVAGLPVEGYIAYSINGFGINELAATSTSTTYRAGPSGTAVVDLSPGDVVTILGAWSSGISDRTTASIVKLK